MLQIICAKDVTKYDRAKSKSSQQETLSSPQACPCDSRSSACRNRHSGYGEPTAAVLPRGALLCSSCFKICLFQRQSFSTYPAASCRQESNSHKCCCCATKANQRLASLRSMEHRRKDRKANGHKDHPHPRSRTHHYWTGELQSLHMILLSRARYKAAESGIACRLVNLITVGHKHAKLSGKMSTVM